MFSTGFCLFNYVHAICFETEIKTCLTLQQYFLVSPADSAVLQLAPERKLGDDLTQCLCRKISQAGKLRVIGNYFQFYLWIKVIIAFH